MPLQIHDRVKETTTSTGTGPITLNGKRTGYRAFSDVCSVGDTVYAVIEAVNASGQPTGEWECGLYTYSAANTLTRTTVTSSSNGYSMVSFSYGTKYVYIDMVAAQIKQFVVANPDAGLMPFGQDPTLYTSIKFQDEFDGAGLDTTKWDTKLWYETAPSTVNYNVSGGCLNIWPQTDATGNFFSRHIPAKFYQIYGYWEIEAQLPMGHGLQPSFWLFSHDLPTGKPTIDVMKSFGGVGNLWTDTSGRINDYRASAYYPDSTLVSNRTMGSTVGRQILSQVFHKFGVRWDTSGLTFFVDGVQLGSKIASTDFKNRMYPLLSLVMGTVGSESNAPSVANTTQGIGNALKINYIRVWQLANAPAGSDNPSAPVGSTDPGGGGGGGTNPTPTSGIIDYYGESVIKGWDGTAADGTIVATPAPLYMQNMLSTAGQWTVNNWGVNGANTSEAIAGIDGHARTWAAQMSYSNAKYVIMEYGLNCALQLSLETYKSNLRQMVDVARAAGKVPIFETPNPANSIPQLANFINNGMKVVATEKGVPVIDQYVYLNGYMARIGLTLTAICPDGLHPSQSTYNLKGDFAAQEFLKIIAGTGGGTTDPAPSGSGPLGQDSSLWQMTFEDHFEGSDINRLIWNDSIYYSDLKPNGRNSYKVENSNLVMCYVDPFDNTFPNSQLTIDTDPQGSSRNRKGMTNFQGFQQTYGYFEARIKLPYGQNVFPAFWIFRHDQREIDIMENFGGEPPGQTWMTNDYHPINVGWTVWKRIGDRIDYGTLHHDWYKRYNANGQLPNSMNYPWLGCNVVDLSAGYHVYACEWEAGRIRFLMDGKPIINENGVEWLSSRMGELANFPMYLMLDFWMQNGSAGSCPRGFGPWEMRVDYVRVWRRK